MRKYLNKNSLFTFLLMNLGSVLSASGIYFFRFPNNFSIGGITGLSVVISNFFPGISTGIFVIVLNMLLLIVGFIFLGKGFGAKTVYTSVMISAFIAVFERFIPLSEPLTSQPLLDLVFAVGLPAVGTAILFNIKASTGGTDIIAMIFAKYTTINVTNGLMFSDILITFGAFVFGIETGLFSLLGLVAKTLVINKVIENINRHKFLIIVTSKSDEISGFITKHINTGATLCEGVGAYTGEKKTLILTVTSPTQAVILRRHIRAVDPNAFLFLTNTSEVMGSRFRVMDL